MSLRTLLTLPFFAFAFLACGASAAAQVDPASLLARDTHQMLLVSADPYVTAVPSKTKFGKHTPFEAGILAVDLYFRNGNDLPIRLDLDTVRLHMGGPGETRRRLAAISPEEVADRTLLNKQTDPRAPRMPLPGSVPRSGRSKEWQTFDGILRTAAMTSEVLPPHSTIHGFFYFDIDSHFDWLPNADIEIPDLEFMTSHQALFFFDIELGPAKP